MNITATNRRPPTATRAAWAALGSAAVAASVLLAATGGSASGDGWDAVAVLRDADGEKVGKVKFEGDDGGTVVKVRLRNVTVGLDAYHGFHLHANDAGGPCDATASSGPFTNVGGHWNPTGAVHGGHAGDLPTVQVLADGTANARALTGRFEPEDIEGRAVILHAGPDNYANVPDRYLTGTPPVAGPDAATRATGDAGGRIACGIVELD